jgi:hypothetical protein
MRTAMWLGLVALMIAGCGGSDHGSSGSSSGLATFTEVEPNDTSPNIVPNNVQISAETQPRDVDLFASIFDSTLNFDVLLCPGNATEQFFFAVSAASATMNITLREQTTCSDGQQGTHVNGQVIPFANNEQKQVLIESDNDAGEGPYTIALRVTTPTGMETPMPTSTPTATSTPTSTATP